MINMGILLSTISIILFIVETALQINVAVTLLSEKNLENFAIVLSLVTGSMVLSNIISAFLVLRTMDFSGKWIGKVICVVLHLFQFGLLWRCLKLYILFDEHDWTEFVSLRLLHTALQSLPFLIIEGCIILNNMNFEPGLLISFIVTLISSSVALSIFNMSKYLFESDEFLEWKARARKPFGVLLLIIGTFLVLISRCGSIILMTTSMAYLVFIPIGIHIFLYLVFVSLSNLCQSKCSLNRILRNFVFSYVNLFDVIDVQFKRIQCKNVIYYTAILIENVIMIALWMLKVDLDYVFKLSTVVLLLVTFICGMIFKFCSCGCVNPETEDQLADDTLNFGIEIVKDRSKPGKSNQRHESILSNEIKKSENKIIFSSHSFTQGRKIEVIDTGILNGMDNDAFQVHEQPQNVLKVNHSNDETNYMELENNNHDPSTPGNASNNKHRERIRRVQNVNGSNAEIASSNSRNTNTLNISVNSNHHEFVTDDKPVFENGTGRRQFYSGATKCIPEKSGGRTLTPSSHGRAVTPMSHDSYNLHNNLKEVEQTPHSGKKPSNKKAAIPLFPNECHSFIEPKSPKFVHNFRNSIDNNGAMDTISDTSYSENLSYSYYIDSTEWSTTSWDSESAMTWPPSNPIILVNLHSLPKERISANDNVRLWLSRLDNWEPGLQCQDDISYENSDEITKVQYPQEMQSESPQYEQFNSQCPRDTEVQQEHCKSEPGVPESGKRKRKLSNLSSMFKKPLSKFRNSSFRREQTPHDISDKFKDEKKGYINDGMLCWKDEELPSPDIVQESMV